MPFRWKRTNTISQTCRGCRCTPNGELFGTLRDVMETGANDVYIVDSKEHGEVLIPAIHDCILDVDLDEQKMTIHLLPGLID